MHAHFIRRCLELAERGRGKVSPNPLVGCVITGKVPGSRFQVSGNNEGEIIAEAWHEEFGRKHAEILAIEKATYNLKPKTYHLRDTTLYVNLEPCSHHGKTPPCTDTIIAAGIKKVVFGARDPLHGGSEFLRKNGVEVIGPVLEVECRHLNRGFFSVSEKGRPWVTVKKALQRDGLVPSEHRTSEEQDAWAHTHLRATHDAILVGSGTVIADNPKLNVRFAPSPHNPLSALQCGEGAPNGGEGIPQPRRIILDPHNEIPPDATILTDGDAERTLIISEKLTIPALLERLKTEGITSVLVEGGPRVWQSFEESGCIDEVVILSGAL